MSPAIEDARTYICIKPVPVWEEASDSKLQARSFDHYTLQEPNREKIFKTNYKRRQEQMTIQGYKSVLWKPYQEIGQPLYLDSKQLVQASLGQPALQVGYQLAFKGDMYNGDERMVERTKAGLTSAQRSAKAKQQKRKMSTASFVMKYKEQKDFQDLFKDLTSVREAMASVKMGHALFPILEKSQNIRDNAFLIKKQNETRNYKDELHMRLSNATFDDETEPESEEHWKSHAFHASRRASIRSAGSRTSIASAGKVSLLTSQPGMTTVKADLHSAASEHVRPYSPMYTNICQPAHNVNVTSVWKQLCCLHWILESCQVEANVDNQYQNKVMVPLSECWDTSNPGGKTRDSRIVNQDRKNNHKWTKFARNQTYKAVLRSRSRRKVSALPFQTPLRKNWSLASDLASYQGDSRRPPSAKSMAVGQHHTSDGSIDVEEHGYDSYEHIRGMGRPMSAGQSSITTTIAGGTVAGSEYGDDDTGTDGGHSIDVDKSVIHNDDSLPEKEYHEHLVKLLSTVKESVGREMDRREKTAQVVAEANQKLPMSVYEWARNSYFKIGKQEVNISKIVVPAATQIVEYSEPVNPPKHTHTTRIRPHTAIVGRTRDTNNSMQSSRPGTAGGTKIKPTRPMSSPAKLASTYNFKFSSEDKSKKLDRIREKFDDINDTKALELHNQLTELDKCRKQRMEVKFDTLRGTCSMHRDFKGMRDAAQDKFLRQKMTSAKRSSIVICEWYNNLVNNLPENIHDEPACSYILQKLSIFGMKMLQNMHNVTPDAFLGALKSLRPWELCSPDVSAAIDYAREHIVNMPAVEFDEWRQSKLEKKEAPVGIDHKQVKA